MPRGRTREFDPDAAVDAALRVFWAKGYDGTSMADLVTATGVQRGSLYSTFGSKEGLFDRVLARYGATVGSYVERAMEHPTARSVIEAVWRGAVEATTAPHGDTAPGCLVVHGALATADDSRGAFERLVEVRRHDTALMRDRLERAAAAGELAPGTDAAALADYVSAVSHGIAVRARSGATEEELTAVVELALVGLHGMLRAD